MKNLKKKIITIAVISIITTSILSGCGQTESSSVDTEKLTTIKTSIVTQVENFDKDDDRALKLEIIEKLVDDFESFNDSELSNDEDVKKSYEDGIEKMQTYFRDSYAKTIEENSFEDLSKIEDIDKLNKAKENLSELKVLIFTEKKNVYGTDEETEIINSISALITSYDTQITDIQSKLAENDSAD